MNDPDDLDAFVADQASNPEFTRTWNALQARKRANDRPRIIPAATDQRPKLYGPTVESEPQPVDLAFAALGKWFHNTTPGAEYTYTGHTDNPADCGICWEAAEVAITAITESGRRIFRPVNESEDQW